MNEPTQPGATPEEDDPVGNAFDADDLLAHMLGDIGKVARDGPEAAGQPAWMGVVARVLDGTILTPRPVADPNVVDLTRRLDAAEETLRSQASKIATLSRKAGKG
jgi:hypothetical protein